MQPGARAQVMAGAAHFKAALNFSKVPSDERASSVKERQRVRGKVSESALRIHLPKGACVYVCLFETQQRTDFFPGLCTFAPCGCLSASAVQ